MSSRFDLNTKDCRWEKHLFWVIQKNDANKTMETAYSTSNFGIKLPIMYCRHLFVAMLNTSVTDTYMQPGPWITSTVPFRTKTWP